jgi:large subunit ribosomal protein L18
MLKLQGRARRKRRIRKKVAGSVERPRLTVFRSSRHMYAQVIDDVRGTTLASASSNSKAFAVEGNKTAVAKAIGQAIAEACKAKGIDKVVFDRNGYMYHGRVKALADAARKAGLSF